MSSVRFLGVRKEFDGTVAVDRLDLEVHDREFLVLLGPSGCGKSTALRMIAGLEDPTEGAVEIGGEDMLHVEPGQRDVAMVFQSYALYPHMTVRRNIEAPLLTRTVDPGDGGARRKLTSAERQRAVSHAASSLGLEKLLGRKPGALSGGQRQRVALARAIVRRPRVFLMDEPLSNLDAKLRTQTRLDLVDLWRQLGTTFVYVTHDQVEAMTMATRVVVMSEGRIQQVGAPQDVYDRPANLFVARFVGTPPMNTLPATINDSDTTRVATVGGGSLPLAGDAFRELPLGAPVTVGVRPEHLSVSDTGTVPAQVRSVERLGHEVQVVTDVDSSIVIVRQQSSESVPAVGTDVLLSADPTNVHLFDPVTQVRMESRSRATGTDLIR